MYMNSLHLFDCMRRDHATLARSLHAYAAAVASRACSPARRANAPFTLPWNASLRALLKVPVGCKGKGAGLVSWHSSRRGSTVPAGTEPRTGMLQLGAVERDARTHAYDGRAIRRTFDELGWVVLPELFSEDELLPMQRRMEEHIEAAAARMGAPRPSGAQFDRRLLEVMEWAETGNPRMTPQAAGLLGLSPFAVKEGDAEDTETGGRAVFDLVTHSELLGALSVLLGPSITYSYAGICRVRLPDATNPPSRSSLPFPLHQDSQYYDTAHFTQDKGERAGTVRPGLEQSTEKLTIATVWMPLVDTDVTNGCLSALA